MIDTIRFKIPITPEIYQNIKKQSKELMRYDNRKDLIEFRFFDDTVKLKSYYRDVHIKINETYSDKVCFLEFSIPKLYYQHNVFLLYPDKVLQVLQDLHNDLVNRYLSFPDINLWYVQRVDFCYSWKYNNEDYLNLVLDFLKSLDYKSKKRYIYDTSVMWSSRSFTLKFYSKSDEFYSHDFKILNKFKETTELAHNILTLSKGILRFEATLRKLCFPTYFPNHNSDTLTIYDVLTYNIDDILSNFINSIITVRPVVMSNEDILTRLIDVYGTSPALRYYMFLQLWNSGKNQRSLLKKYSRSTISRNKLALKNAGIGLNIDLLKDDINISIPSDIVINSSNRAKFDPRHREGKQHTI